MSIHEPKEFVRRWPNLADPRLGAIGVSASDEFFAPKDRMLNPEPAQFIPGKYDQNGKWMDGWETRRKRVAGYDHCIVKLGLPGVIKGVDIDTSHFTGNFPPAASIDVCHSLAKPDAHTQWETLIAPVSLKGNSHHYLEVPSDRPCTHVRLNIYPDGGVARLRIYGQVQRDPGTLDAGKPCDLIAVEHGGRILGCNDAHFGAPENLLMPGRGVNMGDGWETRRRREPGNDWVVIALGVPGLVEEIVVDTAHFKGNYPDRCSLQGAKVEAGTDQSIITQSMFWNLLLPEQKLEMDAVHRFTQAIHQSGEITHVRFNIHPDGGVSRLRIIGKPGPL